MSDRTTMEKPERRQRNFSLIVSDTLYLNLRKNSVAGDTSLGAVCRELLEIITPPLYSKLKLKSAEMNLTLVQLVRNILQEAVK